VKNAEIRERIQGMTSSEQLCRSLLETALDRGGSDNITLIAARALIGEKAVEPAA